MKWACTIVLGMPQARAYTAHSYTLKDFPSVAPDGYVRFVPEKGETFFWHIGKIHTIEVRPVKP